MRRAIRRVDVVVADAEAGDELELRKAFHHRAGDGCGRACHDSDPCPGPEVCDQRVRVRRTFQHVQRDERFELVDRELLGCSDEEDVRPVRHQWSPAVCGGLAIPTSSWTSSIATDYIRI